MNNTGINALTTYQDTVKVKQAVISTIEISTDNQVKVNTKKSVLSIPEVPERFKTPKQKVKSKESISIPSAKNSVVDNQQVSPKIESSSNVGGEEAIKIVGDSVLGVVESPLKGTHETIVIESEALPVEGKTYVKDVLTVLLILSVAITGIIRLTNFKYLREIFSAVVFGQYARKMQKTDSIRNQKAAFSLSGLFLFNTSLFIYEYIYYNHINTPLKTNLLLIPVTMGIVLAMGLTKMMLYRFVAYVFECTQQTNDYIFYSGLYDKLFGLVILPVILIIPYIDVKALPMLFNLGIGIFVLMYLIQLFRGLVIILKNVASLFYMFLYLCALEILPLVVMYNILIK